jgi:hypothetical protein
MEEELYDLDMVISHLTLARLELVRLGYHEAASVLADMIDGLDHGVLDKDSE